MRKGYELLCNCFIGGLSRILIAVIALFSVGNYEYERWKRGNLPTIYSVYVLPCIIDAYPDS